MATLEEIIKRLTLETPSGGSCRIGNAAFTVWYCADIWEWEFRGETYWSIRDLAEALVQGGSEISPEALSSDAADQGHRMQWVVPDVR